MFLTRVRADDSDRSAYGSFWFEPVGLRGLSGHRVTSQTAVTLPIVWACVQLIAKSFALMPFRLYAPADAPARGRVQRRDHWLYRLIARAPNEYQTPYDWRLMLMSHLALRGNAFCQIGSNARGEIVDLLPLHPDRMTIEMLPNTFNWRYRYVDQNGNVHVYSRGEVWHLRWMSDDGIVGRSPIQIAREAIGEGLAMQAYSSKFFANDARPGGWVEYPGFFRDEGARKTFKESWQRSYGGANVRKVAVLERGMKYHELALNNSDAQFIEARREKAYEIPRIWGIPPHKVGVLDKATFSNIEMQAIEFWTDCMLPWTEMWESSMEYYLLGPDDAEQLECDFDMSRLMRGDGASRAAYYQGGINAGWLIRNEAREFEGLDPVPGLDAPLMPLNMTTVGSDGSVQGAAAGPGATPERIEPTDEGDAEGQARLHLILSASAARLTRRAAGALAKRPAADVFDADFAALMAEALGVPHDRASAWCAKFRVAEALNDSTIERGLMACAMGA